MKAKEEIEPSRRSFIQYVLAGNPDDPRNNPWREVDSLAAGPGNVFWSGWASQDEIFVVGDEGAIFHFEDGVWQRIAAPAPVPIHAIFGPAGDQRHAVGWMGAVFSFDGEDWRLLRGCVVGDDGKYAALEENTPLFDLTGDGEGRLWVVGDDGMILTCRDGIWEREESASTSQQKEHSGS